MSQQTDACAAFISWLQQLEADFQAQAWRGALSKWYHGDGIRFYVRASLLFAGARGVQTIVLANLEVDEGLRGRGLLTRMLSQMADPDSRLASEVVAFEHVLSPRLQAYLESSGFIRVSEHGDESPSYYRRRA